MNIYIFENNKLVGVNNYPDVDDVDCIVIDGVRSELEDADEEYLSRIKTYKQELRDITEQENFPLDVVFPDFPKIE